MTNMLKLKVIPRSVLITGIVVLLSFGVMYPVAQIGNYPTTTGNPVLTLDLVTNSENFCKNECILSACRCLGYNWD